MVADTPQKARVEFEESLYDLFVCNTVLEAKPTQEVRMEVDDHVKSYMVS